mmetsp:Transcript_27100/g.51338  ORF Transcript_27100/g.51338 Transcript_27100/m.51338 type:complete len:293 (+) Transcript_27100:250-1128(+)
MDQHHLVQAVAPITIGPALDDALEYWHLVGALGEEDDTRLEPVAKNFLQFRTVVFHLTARGERIVTGEQLKLVEPATGSGQVHVVDPATAWEGELLHVVRGGAHLVLDDLLGQNACLSGCSRQALLFKLLDAEVHRSLNRHSLAFAALGGGGGVVIARLLFLCLADGRWQSVGWVVVLEVIDDVHSVFPSDAGHCEIAVDFTSDFQRSVHKIHVVDLSFVGVFWRPARPRVFDGPVGFSFYFYKRNLSFFRGSLHPSIPIMIQDDGSSYFGSFVACQANDPVFKSLIHVFSL